LAGTASSATLSYCCCKLKTHSGPVVCWLLTINTFGVDPSFSGMLDLYYQEDFVIVVMMMTPCDYGSILNY
jgi:hypothetical protein